MLRRIIPDSSPLHNRIFGEMSAILPRIILEGSLMHRVCVCSWDHTFNIGTDRHQNTFFSSPVLRQTFRLWWDVTQTILTIWNYLNIYNAKDLCASEFSSLDDLIFLSCRLSWICGNKEWTDNIRDNLDGLLVP